MNKSLRFVNIFVVMACSLLTSCSTTSDAEPTHVVDQFVIDAAQDRDHRLDMTAQDMKMVAFSDQGATDSAVIDAMVSPAADMNTEDIGITCSLEDCGFRVPELVDECSGASGEYLLIGCQLNANNECRWAFTECPEHTPCVGTTCEEPCEPWTFFEAGDGCNRCQCGPSMSRRDAYCTSFDCSETGCRDNGDCPQGQYCNFSDDRCGIEGRRGQCESIVEDCESTAGYTCGCDGTYGASSCALLSQTGVDQMPYGGCNIPDLGNAVACGPSVCLGNEFFCRIDLEDPAMPEQMTTSCEPIPSGCVQGDCACLVDKLSTHACFNAGGFVVMVQRTPEAND